jgi:peroxiredoxin
MTVALSLALAVLLADRANEPVADFTLPDAVGQARSLHEFLDAKAVVVVFLGTECPINNAYLPRLAELDAAYSAKGVQFLAVNANRQDTAARVADHAKRYRIPFPVLKDGGHVVADRLGAERTPEAFVLDAERRVRYRGRIDDQFGIGFQRVKPTRNDLAEALDELLGGKAVSQPTTTVAGCLIGRTVRTKGDGGVTYAKDVSRILQANCQECHRPGQIGPMALLSYDDAVSWSAMVREVVSDGRMPPWHADPRHGRFTNDRRLSAADRDTLLKWIDNGCPKGDDKDLPPPRTFAGTWAVGKPDAVFTMNKEYHVPAKAGKNGIPYQYFFIPTNFPDDVWVRAAEVRPGNRAVVHHIIVYVHDPKKGRLRTGDGIGEGFLAAYAPGDMPFVGAPGMAKKVPKGGILVFQMHYTPNGTEHTDQSSVGLVFAPEPPKYEVRTRSIAQRRFEIPPGDGNHEVKSASTFNKEALLVSLLPHMHLRGKSFEYQVVFPDGKRQTLLSVPRYDFNWQSNYRLAEPLRLPAGTRIECTAHFDNSAGNPNNPDPTKLVRWGDQTWQEMMIGFVDYVVPNE